MSLYQDSKGFMWIGTKNGLNRFDGVDFQTYKHVDDNYGIRNSMIYSIAEDKNHRLWIATDAGISIYDPCSDSFFDFNKQTYNDEKIGNYVSEISIDESDRVWILSATGLYIYSQADDKLINLLEKFPFGEKLVPSTFLVKRDTAYIGFPNYGIVQYDVKSEKSSILCKAGFFPTEICDYENSSLLIGTMDDGIFSINKSSRELKNINIDNSRQSNIYVRSITKTSEKEYWIGTETGIYILNGETVRHLEHEEFNIQSISNNAVYAIYTDRDGGIWIGSYFGGVDYIPKQYSVFHNYFPIPYKNSLSGYRVRDFEYDNNDNLWIATEDEGLNCYNLRTGTFSNLTKDKGIASSNIQCLLLSGNNLWIGTYTKGIYLYNLQSNKCVHYEKDGKPKSILNNDIFAIYQDSEGTIWVSSTTELYTYNPDINGFDRFDPLNGAFINDILEDSRGYLWFTTFNMGVIRYFPKTKELKRFNYDKEDPKSLSYNRVTCVIEDSKRRLWFASEDGGFCRFNEKEENFTRITTKESLPSNVVYMILEDNSGNLWLSTNTGLACFNPETMKVIQTYNIEDGLHSKKFNYNAGIKTKDGTLYFGSIDGFVSFKPSEFRKDMSSFSVVLTGLSIFNKYYAGEEIKAISDNAIPYSSNIKLQYNQSTFSIHISAFDYASGNNGRYAYMLEGVDKQWNFAENIDKISYNSIPPGKYLFKVKYSNDPASWNDGETSLGIEIIPPYWKTTLAKIIYAFLLSVIVALTIYALANRRKKQIKERTAVLERKKKEEVYKAEIEFFTNIAHEIRTPLTLIKAPLDNILSSSNGTEDLHENLLTIKRNTDRLITLVNQLLDFRKVESNTYSFSPHVLNVNQLVANTFESFVPMAKSRHLQTTITLPDFTLMACVDEEAMTKILSNLYSNAIKYSDSYVRVSLALGNDHNEFIIRVSNDGIPIPAEKKEKIFEPFVQLREFHPSQPGTGIGLSLASSLVKLHNGRLYLDDKAQDITFVLEVPLSTDYGIDLNEQKATSSTEPRVSRRSVLSDTADLPNASGKFSDAILVVEDNTDLLSFLTKEFRKSYRVFSAENGEVAINILAKHKIDLVISDIIMPVKNGLELCKELKSNVNTSHIPIILLTAKGTVSNKIEGLDTGADAYIEKPFDILLLKVQVKNLLESRKKLRETFAFNPSIPSGSLALNKTDEFFINRLTHVIKQNLGNENFDIEDLAKEMNMSRTNLHRKIKGITGQTPGNLIRIIRLKKAAELLSEGDFRVNEICSMVGISSLSYFSKSFKKQFGVLPKDYAKRSASKA